VICIAPHYHARTFITKDATILQRYSVRCPADRARTMPDGLRYQSRTILFRPTQVSESEHEGTNELEGWRLSE